MTWRRQGDKPFSEPVMVSLWPTYASLGLNELNIQYEPEIYFDDICMIVTSYTTGREFHHE